MVFAVPKCTNRCIGKLIVQNLISLFTIATMQVSTMKEHATTVACNFFKSYPIISQQQTTTTRYRMIYPFDDQAIDEDCSTATSKDVTC